MSECCRKVFEFLSYLVVSVGSIAYSFYLVWLLAHVKDNADYWFFAFIPGLAITFVSSLTLYAFTKRRNNDDQYSGKLWGISLLSSLAWMVMCSFTLLTRQAYYHLPTDVFIGPQWVIMSLKGSIVFFVSGFLAKRECKFESILEDKDMLSQALLDFVDIFNMVEILSLNKCVGIGSSVTEGSSLEMAIQAFCTMSFVIIVIVSIPSQLLDQGSSEKFLNSIYLYSPIYQNIPFLVIRIIVWARHGVFSLGFMVKNIWAIVVCCAKLSKIYQESDDGSFLGILRRKMFARNNGDDHD